MAEKCKVLFDAGILVYGLEHPQSRTGIFFTAYNILREMLRQQRMEIGLYAQNKRSLPKFAAQYLSEYVCEGFYGDDDDLGKFSAYFSPYNTPPSIIRRHPGIVPHIFIHDLIPLVYPQYYLPSYSAFVADILNELDPNDFFYANSDYTRGEFLRYVQVPPENVKTVHLAANEKFHVEKNADEDRRIRKKYAIPSGKRYFLSVCTLEPRKNILMAIRAFLAFVQKHAIPDLVFVLCGGTWPNFEGEIEKHLPEIAAQRNVIHRTGYVDDDDLAGLYSNAECFVYTSRYEGFGLPPLEAMQCGCPVVVSNNSSLPEVVGEAGIQIDCDSIEEHVAAFEHMYFDASLRASFIRIGLARATMFSWEKCARQITDAILDVHKRGKSKPRVTIIITPSLEDIAETYRSIQSVLTQDYEDKEVIVVTAGKLDELNSFSKQLLLINNSMIKSHSLESAIKQATGDYIAFLSPGSYYRIHNAISLSIRKIQETRAEYSYADSQMRVGNKNIGIWVGDKEKILLGKHFNPDTVFLKTSTLREMGGIDVSFMTASFDHAAMRLVEMGKRGAYVPSVAIESPITHEYSEERQEWHARAVHAVFGEKTKLELRECRHIYDGKLFKFDFRPIGMELLRKISCGFGASSVFKEIVEGQYKDKPSEIEKLMTPENWQYKLFGFIPLVCEKTETGKKFYIAGLPLMRVKKRLNRISYYLFNIIPLLSVRLKSRR